MLERYYVEKGTHDFFLEIGIFVKVIFNQILMHHFLQLSVIHQNVAKILHYLLNELYQYSNQ